MNDEINTEQPLMLQPQCVDCRFYDGFGACIEHGYQLRDKCKDFVGMETIHKYVEDMDNNEQKHPILQKLEEYFKNTPKEQIDKDWSDILKDTDSEAYFEKKYNAALERARVYHTGGSICDAHMTEVIFPELQESEDERIQKGLIKAFGTIGKKDWGGLVVRNILNWLEKQGKQKEKIFEFKVPDWYEFKASDWYVSKVDGKIRNIYQSVDKVEPKFKVGDWVRFPLGIIAHIDSLNSTDYQVTTTDGKICDFKISLQDCYHLWTIADAKNGDVIAWDNSKCIALFKDIYDENLFNSYGFVGNCTGSFEPNQPCLIIEGTHPATKEQRDQLFHNMKEAGYEWDTNNKELKKMEVANKEIDDAYLQGICDAKHEIEKQSEKQGKSVLEAWKDMRLEVYQQASGNRHEPNYSDDNTKMFSLNDIDEIIEKIGEQKIDKVESKFKVKDWVILNGTVARILDKQKYGFVGLDIDGKDFFCNYGHTDSMRLWTIADAKDGDVLVTTHNDGQGLIIFIFKRVNDDEMFCHCLYDSDMSDKLCFDAYRDSDFLGGISGVEEEFSPATKEQRELLFQKMADAGYEWDADKKELKKIEVVRKENEDEKIKKEELKPQWKPTTKQIIELDHLISGCSYEIEIVKELQKQFYEITGKNLSTEEYND